MYDFNLDQKDISEVEDIMSSCNRFNMLGASQEKLQLQIFILLLFDFKDIYILQVFRFCLKL